MMQYEELVFEVVRGGTLYGDVLKLHGLADVAGLGVGLSAEDGRYFLTIRYNEEITEEKRSRNAGRPRKPREVLLTCGEVSSLKQSKGAKVAAAALGMPIATFYRRYNENKEKRAEDPFV